jgi:hypothetical protein
VDTLESIFAAEPRYQTISGVGGRYRIPFLNTRRVYRIVSYLDDNRNSVRDPEETVGCAAGSVGFQDTLTVEKVDIQLCGERLAGVVEGRVDSVSLVDTLRVGVVVRAVDDSTQVYRVLAGVEGRFGIPCILPGDYLVTVFYDIDRNTRRDPSDSVFALVPDTLRVEPCRKVDLGEVGLVR